MSIGGTDYASGDSYWPVLPDRKHGGNGSMFFVPARSFRTVDRAPQRKSEVRLRAEWPAKLEPGVGWILPVHVTLSDAGDQGPYYLRVTSLGPRLVRPDSGWLSAGGGAPWVQLSDDARRPLSRYSDAGGDMTAYLAFDEPPQPGDLFLQLNAAPDGGFGTDDAATGDWKTQTVAYLPKVDGAARTLTVDPVEYLTGAAMEKACRDDAVPVGAYGCEFYYARNTGKGTSVLPIAPDARVTLADYGCGNPICPDDFEYTPPDNTVEGLARAAGSRPADAVPLLATVTVSGGKVVEVAEIYPFVD